MTRSLDLSGVEIRGTPIRATDVDVDNLEKRLSVTFPVGYREYVTRLGDGILNDFVRVFAPWRVLAELDGHQGLMAGYWLWESGGLAFDQDAATRSIPIADTLDGDVMAFDPASPDQIVVLPRHLDRIYAPGSNLLEVIDWVCSANVIRSFGSTRYFEPLDRREKQVGERSPAQVAAMRGSFAMRPPRLTGSPREVLLAFFEELRAVEEWAIERSGGHAAFERDDPPEMNEEDFDELIGRSDEVYRRYCSQTLATALSGASVTVASPAEHDPASIRILDESVSPHGRVTVRVAVGTEFGEILDYVLEESDGGWRITTRRVHANLDG